MHSTTSCIVGRLDRTRGLLCTSEWSLPQLYYGAVPPIGNNCLLLATSTSMTGFNRSHGTQLRATHRQPRPNESTYPPMLAAPAGKAITLAALVGYLWQNVSTQSGPLNNSCSENAASLIRMFGAFATLYKSTLRHFPHVKYNSTSHVLHCPQYWFHI